MHIGISLRTLYCVQATSCSRDVQLPRMAATSFAGRTRTLSPTCVCPDSILAETLNPEPVASKERFNERRRKEDNGPCVHQYVID